MMGSRGDSYENFCANMRQKYKKEKYERKEGNRLREINYVRMIESSPDSNDERAIQRAVEKGEKWWKKVTRYYFRRHDPASLQNHKQYTTSHEIIDYGPSISTLKCYFEEVVLTACPFAFLDDSLRILFRYLPCNQEIATYIMVSYFLSSLDENSVTISSLTDITPDPSIALHTFHCEEDAVRKKRENLSEQELDKICNETEPHILAYCDSYSFIDKMIKLEAIWRDSLLTEIEKEEQSWLMELEEQHGENIRMWEQIEDKADEENRVFPRRDNIEEEVEKLKKALIRGEIYVYFRSGYEDKSHEDLDKANEFFQANEVDVCAREKFFETDCQVCFCTKNEINNKVIYCDMCKTSFHFGCYGLEGDFSEDEEFLCDICMYLKEKSYHTHKVEYPSCQICGRSKFPTKKIEGHFYHVSCLALFNFADIKDFQIRLKPGISHQKIMNTVIENQLENDYCEFCIKTGMKIRCASSLCARSFHPICAYLHGCIFSISRSSGGNLSIQVQCREHFEEKKKELFEQVYTRRFFSNFKNTSKISFTDFEQLYQEQLKKIKKYTECIERDSGVRKILKITKTVISYLERQRKSKEESGERKKKETNKTETSELIKELQKKFGKQ